MDSNLIEKLMQENEKKGYIDDSSVERISRALQIPPSRVFAIASEFPSLLISRRKPLLLEICHGPACALSGASSLLEALRSSKNNYETRPLIGSPYWHNPIMAELRGARERVSVQGLSHKDVSVEEIRLKGSSKSFAIPYSVKKRARIVNPLGRRYATSVHSGAVDFKKFLSTDGSGKVLKALKGSRIQNRATGRALARDIQEIPPVGDRTVICDVGGGELENSTGCVIAALAPAELICGIFLVSMALDAKEVIIVVPFEDKELEQYLSSVLLDFEKYIPSSIEAKVLSLPSHIPCEREIGLASVINGMTLSEAAAKAGRDGMNTLWRNPTLLCDPEAFIKVSRILSEGEDQYRAILGGTAVFSVGGKIKKPCIVEVPLSCTFDEILKMVGGPLMDSKLKAVQIVGLPSILLPASEFKRSLKNLLSRHPNWYGQILFIDHGTCMVRWSSYLAWLASLSCCGACTPGRLGPSYITNILEGISKGEGSLEDLEELTSTIELIEETSLCPQGRLARVISNTISRFGKEFKEHIEEGKCEAGVCHF